MTLTRNCTHCGASFSARSTASYHCSVACRFWDKVDRSGGPDSCWNWTAKARMNGGNGKKWYGKFLIGRKTKASHRVAWELTHGAIPVGQNVLHRCDNPLCCNPGHFFLGTQKDNAQDMVQKGRYSCGEQTEAVRQKRSESAKRFWERVKATRPNYWNDIHPKGGGDRKRMPPTVASYAG